MSRIDVFTQLIVAAANARHDGTSPEIAEAARLTLMGHLPPLPPCVALMTQTSWREVAQVAISPAGKLVVLGIEKNGDKEIIEWTVISDRWTSRYVDSTWNEMRVDHLHYPEESDDVAYTVTKPDGGTMLFWGNWSVVIEDTSYGPVRGIFCLFDGDMRKCVVTYERKSDHTHMTAALFIEGQMVSGSKEEHNSWEIASGDGVHVLGQFGDRIVVRVTEEGHNAMCLVGQPGEEIWQSQWYDHVSENSAMERDGNFSFVGYNLTSYQDKTGCRGDAYLVSQHGSRQIASGISHNQIHCLPSGRILIEEREEGCRLRLRDALPIDDTSSNGIDLMTEVQKIHEIVETRTGIAIHANHGVGGYSLLLVDWETDTVWGITEGAFRADVMQHFRRWDDNLVFQSGNRLMIIPVARVEAWLDRENSIRPGNAPLQVYSYPLYTPFDRLVPTEEGILSWHFVNGTFYIIRYPFPE